MKKHVWMFVAIVVLALPLKANHLTPSVCEEETIAAMVSKTKDVLSCLETLTAEERLAYYESAALAGRNEQLSEMFSTLSHTSRLNAFTEFKKLLISSVKKMGKQTEAYNSCDVAYLADLDYCFTVYGTPGNQNPRMYSQCVANAYYVYERCLAP